MVSHPELYNKYAISLLGSEFNLILMKKKVFSTCSKASSSVLASIHTKKCMRVIL